MVRASLSPDPEVSFRAVYICKRLTGKPSPPEARREALRLTAQAARTRAQAAFQRGNYEEMAKEYVRLAAREPPDPLDLIWLGHARQLAGDWPAAARAYSKAAEAIGAFVRAAAGDATRVPQWMRQAELTPAEVLQLQENLKRQRAALWMLVGRVQRTELHKPLAAAETLAKAARALEIRPGRPGLVYPHCQLLIESAECLERAGRIAPAIRTWEQVRQACLRGNYFSLYRPAEVLRLLRKLPGEGEVPPTPGLILLSPGSPERTLDLDDPKTSSVASSYVHVPRKSVTQWYFALVSPRGLELATIELECEFEQVAGPKFASVSCEAHFPGGRRVSLGRARPPDMAAGRMLRRRRFEIPPGADYVRLHSYCAKDRKTHRVKAKATFRPAVRPDTEPAQQVRLWTEFLPHGGRLTHNGHPGRRRDTTFVSPGRHVFQYAIAGGERSFRLEVNLPPQARCGVFVNLDSPFRPTLTNLRMIGKTTTWPTSVCNSLARLTDGSWLLAFDGPERKIMLTTSKDLVHWSKPRPLSYNSVFRNQAPSLLVDADGTIWLAWFSNRLHTESVWLGEGYRLWLSKSRDAQSWSRPRPISVGKAGSWPADPVRMLRDPGGRYWVLWRGLYASAESMDKITGLSSISMPGKGEMYNVSVALDPDRGMWMVFDRGLRSGLFFSRSKDGKVWNPAVQLLKPLPGRALWRGQLVSAGDRCWLLYEHDNGAYLRLIEPGARPQLGEPVKIGNQYTQLNSTSVRVTRDGRAVLLVGAEMVWLLRARLGDVLGKTVGDEAHRRR